MLGISGLKNITILYVEDENELQDITISILKDFTKEQFSAKDGEEGLEIFKKNQNIIDLVISDINIPKINGIDMIKEIRLINPTIPVIITSAFSDTNYLLDAIEIGVDEYILKPVDMKKLLDKMVKSLLHHEIRDLYMDKLTHLPNRNKLKKDLEANCNIMMALVNINQFTNINDLYGEECGDELLFELSLKLKNDFYEDIYKIYHIESDKFGIICKNNFIKTSQNNDLDDDKQALRDFKRKCSLFLQHIENNPIKIGNYEIDINMTIGIATGKDAHRYSQRAIIYARQNLERVVVYDHDFNMQYELEKNIIWLKKIKNAIKENRFIAYFQPIVDSNTKEIHKYEALLRYIDEDGAVISPLKFLDIARKAKLYPKIIVVMIEEALNLIKEKNKRVAVNISYDDIANSRTLKNIFKLLNQNSDYTHLLEFEILESEQIKNFDEVIKFIHEIKKYNCKVGVDDFGAGYSNFIILTNLDINYIKIDGSLIENLNNHQNKQIIIQMIATFSKKFGFKTIAEFVSNEDIYNKVKELGVDYCQGYYFCEPISFDMVK